MDLRNIDISKIDNLDNYYSIFANMDFYENNNLHVDTYSAALITDAPICNRTTLINYIALINRLFYENDYFEFEIRVELGILRSMKNELTSLYDSYKSELVDEDSNHSKYWGQKHDEERENGEIRMRLYYLDQIKEPLDLLIENLEKRLDSNLKR